MAINSSNNMLADVSNDQPSPLWTSQNLRVSLQAIYEHTFYNNTSTSSTGGGTSSSKTIKTIVLTVSYKDDDHRKSSPLAKSLTSSDRDSQLSSSDADGSDMEEDDNNTLAYLSNKKKSKPKSPIKPTSVNNNDGEFMEFAKFEKTFSDFYNLDVKVSSVL
jgi:hypothetical protein